MRIAGTYFNDHEVLALVDRLRGLGLSDSADRLLAAYYRDAREVEGASLEQELLIPSLDKLRATLGRQRA